MQLRWATARTREPDTPTTSKWRSAYMSKSKRRPSLLRLVLKSRQLVGGDWEEAGSERPGDDREVPPIMRHWLKICRKSSKRFSSSK